VGESLEDKIYSQITEEQGLGLHMSSGWKVLSRAKKVVGIYDLVDALTEFRCGGWDLEEAIEFFKTYDSHEKMTRLLEALERKVIAKALRGISRSIFGQQNKLVGMKGERFYYEEVKIWRESKSSRYSFVTHPKGVSRVMSYSIREEVEANLGSGWADVFLKENVKIGGEPPKEVADVLKYALTNCL